MSFFNFLRGSSDDAAARPAFAADFTPPPAKVRGTRLGSILDGNIPDGDPATAWQRRRDSYKLVSPLNTKKFTVVVVGTGLAGAGCAAALGERAADGDPR